MCRMCSLALRLRPVFHCLQYSKAGEGLLSFLTSRKDRKDGRKGLIVYGRTGPRTANRANIAGNLPHVSIYM